MGIILDSLKQEAFKIKLKALTEKLQTGSAELLLMQALPHKHQLD
jgi:hypothetical protein